MFYIKYKDGKTKARVGELETKSGRVETPFFMPVTTNGTAKYITTRDLENMRVKVVISNALLLYFRPGINVLNKFNGIKSFMGFNGINFTDSGGFQMYSKHIFEKSCDKGVHFRDPYAGKKIFMTPEENMKIQLQINSDVAMCLDSMPMYEHSKEDIKEAVRKTLHWAERCKKEHNKIQSKRSNEKRQLLFGITQGGIYSDLRKTCCEKLVKLNFDGYSIGGFGLGESFACEMKIVEQQKKIIPENKPVYLMGIGSPWEILEAVSHGVDIFDSRLPTKNARHGQLFTSKGELKLMNKKYEKDVGPIDKECECYVCKRYSRAYIRHLLQRDEGTGKTLVSYHNLHYLTKLLEKAKEEIRKGKFNEFKIKIRKIYYNSHTD
jgi:queuine tRNA-ribosyltransferase